MTSFAVQASYTKKEQTTELKPTFTNTVTVNGVSLLETSDGVAIKLPSKEDIKKRTIEPKVVINDEVSDESEIEDRIIDVHNFERKLLSITLSVLSSRDKQLIQNIVDRSGEIILSRTDLTELIKIATGKSADDIFIEIDESVTESGCLRLCKPILIYDILKIQIDGHDFNVKCNKIYNAFARYKVSMTKVVL